MNKDISLIEVDYGYNHLEVGHPDNPKNFRICGSRTTSENAKGPLCLHKAGYGTSHSGRGRCKYHGGCSLSGPDHPRWKYGQYSPLFRGRVKEAMEKLKRDDTDPLDIIPELEMQRVLYYMGLEQLDQYPQQPLARRVDAVVETKEVGRLGNDVDNKLDVMGVDGPGRGNGDGCTPLDVPRVGFSPIPSQNGSIELRNSRIRPEDLQTVRDLGNDVINTRTKIIQTRNQTALTKIEIAYIFSMIKGAMSMYVPKENQKAFVDYLLNNIPIIDTKDEEDGGISDDI